MKLAGNSKSQITVTVKKAYRHKGEAENNEAPVWEPGGNREEQEDGKYRRTHRDIQIIKSYSQH